MQNRGEESTTKYSDHNSTEHRDHRYIFHRYEAISYQILSVDAPLNWIGAAAFEFVGDLTIELRVAVGHRWDSNQHLASVSLHHQLQLPARLLDELPRVAK